MSGKPKKIQKIDLREAKLEEVRNQFIQGAGSISVSLLGMLNRVCGQIYALVYLSKDPLSLDEIVLKLGVSKGSVSINIRILEDYKLVRKVWVKGSRKDYYEAVGTLPKKVIKEFFDKIRRNIHDSRDMIRDCLDAACKAHDCNEDIDEQAKFMQERLQSLINFYDAANILFDAIYSGQTIDTTMMKSILEG